MTTVATAIGLVGIISFTTVKHGSKQVNDVVVHIQDQNGDFFTDQLEILNLINAGNTDYVLSLSIGNLDLKALEERVESNPFVADAQIFRDIKGNLIVNVRQVRPLARIFDPKGEDRYISEEGWLLPTTARHTARVPIVELERKFSWEHSLMETAYGREVMSLLTYIEEDPFWKAQIAGLIIQKDGQVQMLPQVTKQKIVFGMPDGIEGKFKKLKLFYKKVLPNKGWNTYSLVNVKFKNQIVCE